MKLSLLALLPFLSLAVGESCYYWDSAKYGVWLPSLARFFSFMAKTF
jgi:hypothetical protein